ncbi:MAG TPA: hypothetical protein PKL69_01825 [Agitococcus sp.]|nr:hypothetical protein [Agitococcus sp.]
MENQRELDLKTKVSNCIRTTLLQIGVDSYRIDAILETLVLDILTVLIGDNNVKE